MTVAAESREKGQRYVYYAFLVYPFVNITLMLLMIYSEINISESFMSDGGESVFMPIVIMLVVISLATVALIGWIKNLVWGIRKKTVHSVEDFSTAYFGVNMVYIAFLESIGIYGLLIFFLTGNLLLAAGLNILSFIGMLINFPTKAEKEERMKQFHFDRMNT